MYNHSKHLIVAVLLSLLLLSCDDKELQTTEAKPLATPVINAVDVNNSDNLPGRVVICLERLCCHMSCANPLRTIERKSTGIKHIYWVICNMVSNGEPL